MNKFFRIFLPKDIKWVYEKLSKYKDKVDEIIITFNNCPYPNIYKIDIFKKQKKFLCDLYKEHKVTGLIFRKN